MNKRSFLYVLGPMRVPFLILTPACVLLGIGTAFRSTGGVSIFLVVLIMAGAVCAHISVNAFNEYFDFKSGLDFRTTRTPFSGGSGTLPEHPHAASYALATALITLTTTGLIGIYFLSLRGFGLLPLGIIGLVLIYAYTPWLTRSPFLCLFAPGLGFGPLMVMGTHYVLAGSYSASAFIASLIPFFLVSNLLLLNQYPDVEADRSIGRRPCTIAFGKRTSTYIFGAFLFLTYLSIIMGVLMHYLPSLSLLGLLTLLVSVPAYFGAFTYAENIKKLTPYMGLNVITNIATPALIAIGLFIG
jgi:1,4-dihydroxy-2-naphthoate polyprenyltransferase